jgi:hypothetical protein
MMSKILQELLSQDLVSSNPSDSRVASYHTTTPDGVSYRQQVAAINVLSYSTSLTLHSCPRRFLLEKITAGLSSDATDNVDFLYGHAVGAGVQCYTHTRSIKQSLWDAFLSWKGDLLLEIPKSKKSFWNACIGIMNYAGSIDDLLGDWGIAILPNGKPAIEVAFMLDLGNGYIYMGHIDAILYSPTLNQFMVLELKTTRFNTVHSAQYKNSGQALGYSLIVDVIAKAMAVDAVNYQVLYAVYKTGLQEWEPIPFVKTRSQRAQWLLQLRIDCSIIDMYREIDHFPTHGESCFSFFRPCEFFESCDIKSQMEAFKDNLIEADAAEAVKGIDYIFHIADLAEIV